MNKWLDILDSLGLFEWSEKQPDDYAPGGSWSRDDIEDILSVIENEYGGVSDKLDKTNIIKAIGKKSWNVLTNQSPDPYEGKFFDKLYSKYSAVAIRKLENRVELIEKNHGVSSVNIGDTYKAIMIEIYKINKRLDDIQNIPYDEREYL